ncbi:MAG: head decoration protein [Deltaproteobacteria bacterium]|nr:head decoration protein [Deltaproteobacteria bacterium]
MTLDFGRTDTVHTQDNLIAGPMPRSEVGIVLASGENLSRGAPLGRVTATGKYKEWDPNASDGTQNFRAILAEDCDASGGDENCVAYFSGQFNYDGIQWDADKHQKDDRLDAILEGHDRGIFILGHDIGVSESAWTSTSTTTTSSTSTTTSSSSSTTTTTA